MQRTTHGHRRPDSNRTVARIVGVLFLSAFFAYGGGTALLATIPEGAGHLSSIAADSGPLRAGAILMLLNSFVVAAIGVLLLGVARPHGEGIAFGYLGARLVESVVLAVGVVFLLLQVPLGRELQESGAAGGAQLQALSTLAIQGNASAYQVAMVALGIGSVPFWYLFYRARLVPRLLAAWGIVGYAVFVAGSVAELRGLEVGLLLSLPAGLFEVAVGIWLIVKGFSARTTLAASAEEAATLPADGPMAVAT